MGESTVVVFFTLVIGTLIAFFYLEKQNQIKADEIINRYRNTKPEPTPDIPTDLTPIPVQVDIAPSTGGMMATRPDTSTPTPIQIEIGPSVGVMESIRPETSTPTPSASVPSNVDTTTLDLFTYFDGDGDGEVNSSEFLASIVIAGSELSNEQLQLTYDTFDENGDGMLNFAEFGAILAPPPSVFEGLPDTFAPAPNVFEALPDTFAPAPSATSSSLNELCDQYPWNDLCKYRPGWTGIRPTIEEANVEPETDPVTTNTQNDINNDLCTKFPWNDLCRDRPGWTGIKPVDETNITDTNTQFDAVCDIQPWQSFCSYRSGWTGIKPPEALGDDAMSAGKYNDAVDFFTNAIETSEPSMTYILYGKRASAYINLEDFQSALTDANTIDPNISGENATAARLIRFERSGVALYGLDRFTEAKDMYQAGIDAGYTSGGLVLGLRTATRAEEDARLFTINSQTPSPSTVESSVDTSTPSPSTFAPSPSTFAPSPSTFAPSPSTPVVNTRSTVLDSLCATPVGLTLEKCSEYPGSTWEIETTSPDTDQGGSQMSEAQKQILDQICDTSPLSDTCKNHDPARYQLALEANLPPDTENDIVVTTPAGSFDFLADTCNTFPWLDACKKRDPEKWQRAVDAREAEAEVTRLTRLCTDTPWDPQCEGREGYEDAVEEKALDAFCETSLANLRCSEYDGHQDAVEEKNALDTFCEDKFIDPKCEGQPGYEDTMVALLPSVAPTSYTSSTEDFDGMPYYDRQNIACEDDASINTFRTRPGAGSVSGKRLLKIDYKCKPKQGTLWKKNETVKTAKQSDQPSIDENNLYASVGMDVDCEEKPISSFTWTRRRKDPSGKTGNVLDMDYTCVDTNSPNIKPECRTITESSGTHVWAGVFLKASCDDDEVLTRFKNYNPGRGTTTSTGQVTEYTCCKYPDLPESRKALRKLCSENLWDPSCSEYDGHQEAVELNEFCETNLADPKCLGYAGHEKAKLDAFCTGENLADPKCSEYDGHLDAFCETSLANPDCSEYDGHLDAILVAEKAKLDAFCIGENLADSHCSEYDGHLDAFCIGENLADSQCSEYDGHKQAILVAEKAKLDAEKAKLDAFCIGENLAYPKCEGQPGHEKAKLDAFCTGENLADPKCEGQLEKLCETNLADPNCSGYDNHDIAVSITNELDDEILTKLCENQLIPRDEAGAVSSKNGVVAINSGVEYVWKWNADKACRQTSSELGLEGRRCGWSFGGTKCPGNGCCSGSNWCASTTGTAKWDSWCTNRTSDGYMGQNRGRFDGTASKDEADKIARRPSTFASDVMTRLAARGVLCQNNLADPKCLGYEGHLDAFCIGENLADPKCSEYTGHEKAKLDAFCIGENLADPKCSGYDGHEQAKLNAFCIGENLADSQCSEYDGHEKAKLNAFCIGENLADPKCSEYDGHLNAFCETNLADSQCSEYDGHLDAFCIGENLTDSQCEGQLGEFCKTNLADPNCSAFLIDATATYIKAGTKSHWSITNSSGPRVGRQIDSVIFITNAAGTRTMEATDYYYPWPGHSSGWSGAATFNVRQVPDTNTTFFWQVVGMRLS